eukprot:COSAG02_NODE_1681_length_11351_cov_20.077320_2_plen_78_part_00
MKIESSIHFSVIPRGDAGVSISTEKCFEMPKHSCQNAGECREVRNVPMSVGRGAECQKHCRHPIDVPKENAVSKKGS